MLETFSSYYVPIERESDIHEKVEHRIKMLTHAHTLRMEDAVSGHSVQRPGGRARTTLGQTSCPRYTIDPSYRRLRSSAVSDRRERNVPIPIVARAFSVWHFPTSDTAHLRFYHIAILSSHLFSYVPPHFPSNSSLAITRHPLKALIERDTPGSDVPPANRRFRLQNRRFRVYQDIPGSFTLAQK